MSEVFEPLSDAQRIRLLQIARQSIFNHVSRRRPPSFDETDARLNEQLGVFCTLNIGERLRGCIGTFGDSRPLWETVVDVSIGAASNDPRFSPIRMDQIPKLDIELSVMSPLRQVSADDVEVGKHGLLITVGRSRGTLLPQVATQFDWTREQFLSETCTKGGLAGDAWRADDARIEVFEADVFSESGLRGR